jgi:glycerophosphoryl diester phosphodiesterase
VTEARPLRLAHRGDHRRAPENTIAAFDAAIANPACDGIEFDVRLSSDGVPVVYHDPDLLRIHGRPERVDELTAAALQEIGVPSLQEVLAAAGRRAFLDVELKADLGSAVVEVMVAGRGPDLDRSAVSSFEPEALEAIARLAPRWPRWLVANQLDSVVAAVAKDLRCTAVAIHWQSIDPGAVRVAKAADLEVVAWPVRQRPTYDRLARIGVSAVCVTGAAVDA